MSFRQYLGAFLLAGASLLYSPSLQAENIQRKVTFTGSSKNDMIENLEGTLNVSATRDKNKLVLEVSAEKCEIRTGFSEFYLCLPVKPEITEMKQTAEVDERTQDGRGYEAKWIDLMPNEAFEKTSIRLASWLVGQVPIPFLSEAMDKVQDNKRTQEEELARTMKKKSLVIMKLSPHYPKMPGAYTTTIARKYEITLDMEPDKTPEAYLQVCLQDPNGRTFTIDEILVKFDGKSQKPQTEKQAGKFDIPKSLDDYLIDDKDLKMTNFYGPKELSEVLNQPAKNSYFIKYQTDSKPKLTIFVQIGEMNNEQASLTPGFKKWFDEIMGEYLVNDNYKPDSLLGHDITDPVSFMAQKDNLIIHYFGLADSSLLKEYRKTKNIAVIKSNIDALIKKISEIRDEKQRKGMGVGNLMLPNYSK